MGEITPELQPHVDTLADPNADVAAKHAAIDSLESAGISIWQIIAIALATETMLAGVKAAVDAGQATTVGDPTTGGPFSLYIDGKHCDVGPIPVAPAP